ncbi:tail fiber domain-containing protein, partial [Rothia kristinae]
SDYVFNNNGTASAANWVNTSDIRVKRDIAKIEDPLTKMRSIRGVSWTMRFKNNPLKGFGFIAQEVQKYFPDAVRVVNQNPVTLEDDTVVEDVMSVDTAGVSAALHHEAILALMDKMEDMQKELEALKAELAAMRK